MLRASIRNLFNLVSAALIMKQSFLSPIIKKELQQFWETYFSKKKFII